MHLFLRGSVAFLMFAACVAQSPGTAGPMGPQAQPQQGASCEGACSHYLQCKGSQDPSAQQICVDECYRRQIAAADLAEYQQTDCQTAIMIIEGNGGNGGNGGAGGQPAQTADCQGCVRDGDSCVWISQSNWGKGPYSGAVSSCDSSCCGM